MASVTVTISDNTVRTFEFGGETAIDWTLSQGSYLSLGTALSQDGITELFLGRVFAYFTGVPVDLMGIRIASSQSVNSNDAGPDFSDQMESSGTITFVAEDGSSVEVTGIGDATEPYFWTPSNSAAVLAFFSGVDGLTGQSLTVTFDDNADQAPTADAGPDQSVAAGVTVNLDGSGSSDQDGTIASYSWARVSGPTVTLTGASTATPSFTAPSQSTSSTIVLRLTVTDDDGATDTDNVSISVAAVVVTLTAPFFTNDTGATQSWTQNVAIATITVPTATGNPTPTYAAVGALPAGITFNTGNRRLTGTPTTVASGTIRIRATNSQGSDDWMVAYTTTAALAVPGTPTNLQVDTQTTTTITLSVSPGSGGTPTGYRWRLSTNGFMSNSDTVINTTGPLVTFTGLNVDTSYWVDVRAENSAGESSYNPSGSNGLMTATLAAAPTTPVTTSTNLVIGTLSLVVNSTEIAQPDVETSSTLSIGTISFTVTSTEIDAPVAALALSDIDDVLAGLDVEMAALLVATAPGTTGNSFYEDSSRGGSGTPIEGELGLGSGETVISRLRRTSNAILTLNDNNLPSALDFGVFFDTGGDGRDLTLYLQTTSDGLVSFTIVSAFFSAGGNWLNVTLPVVARTLLDNLATGDNFIIAMARPATVVAPDTEVSPPDFSIGTVSIAVANTEIDDPVTIVEGIHRLDSLNALDTYFSRESGTNSGHWEVESSGGSGSGSTGPASNSLGPYVLSDASGGSPPNIAINSVLTVLDTVMSTWTGTGRMLSLRVCVAGSGWTDVGEGFQVQGKVLDSDSWESITLIQGWPYSNTYQENDSITDANGDTLICSQAGGWVDIDIPIPDNYTTVRLFSRPNNSGTVFHHDIALWNVNFVNGLATSVVETSSTLSLGTLSFTITNTEIITTPSLEVTLPSSEIEIFNTSIIWRNHIPLPNLGTSLSINGSTTLYLQEISLPRTAAVDFGVGVTLSDSDIIIDFGPDFSAQMEASGTIRVEASNGASVTINLGDSDDLTEPYFWTPPNQTDVNTFTNTVAELSDRTLIVTFNDNANIEFVQLVELSIGTLSIDVDNVTVTIPVPDSPTGLAATATHNTVFLTWDDPSDSTITSYQILRRNISDGGSLGVHIDNVPIGTAYADTTDVSINTFYSYRIKARNSQGLSNQSSFANIITALMASVVEISPPNFALGSLTIAEQNTAIVTVPTVETDATLALGSLSISVSAEVISIAVVETLASLTLGTLGITVASAIIAPPVVIVPIVPSNSNMQGFVRHANNPNQALFNRLLWQYSSTLSAGFEGVIRLNPTTKRLQRDNGTSWENIILVNAADNIASLRSTNNVTGAAAPYNHSH